MAFAIGGDGALPKEPGGGSRHALGLRNRASVPDMRSVSVPSAACPERTYGACWRPLACGWRHGEGGAGKGAGRAALREGEGEGGRVDHYDTICFPGQLNDVGAMSWLSAHVVHLIIAGAAFSLLAAIAGHQEAVEANGGGTR